MAKITKAQKERILHLSNTGLSNTEISRALGIDPKTVKKNLGGKNVSTNKTTSSSKEPRQNRGVKTSSEPIDPERRIQDPNSSGDRHEKTTKGESLIFVGGKKYMGKKEGSEAKEEKDEYQCFNCGHTQGSKFTDCPKCGTVNTFDE